MYTKQKTKELAMICSTFYWLGLEQGTIFQTFDEVYKLAKEFISMYPPDHNWEDEELDYDEVVQDFYCKKLGIQPPEPQ